MDDGREAPEEAEKREEVEEKGQKARRSLLASVWAEGFRKVAKMEEARCWHVDRMRRTRVAA